jgi:hypothetical protein
MFSGGLLLSHNAVNESCYIAKIRQQCCEWRHKISTLNVVYSKILYENDDIFKKRIKYKRCRNIQAFD